MYVRAEYSPDVGWVGTDRRLLKKFFQVPKFSGCGGIVPDRGCNNDPAGSAVVRIAFRGRRQISFSYKDRWFVRADL